MTQRTHTRLSATDCARASQVHFLHCEDQSAQNAAAGRFKGASSFHEATYLLTKRRAGREPGGPPKLSHLPSNFRSYVG